MFEAGLSLEEIGDYVGHNSAYMTDRYRTCARGTRRGRRSASTPSSLRLAQKLAHPTAKPPG